ncbi:N acyl phosphatidylethanolamine hydrolyzing [Trichuris trichiura]|uniref:N-acetylphosphatidylethanolamine-hydrolyzing phospholipase D n=1 Tax=Trichuris trichiura TaxID=36087 RepID=A0A077ZF93_TRITR|nr:N acyl phosphatidylethanolamine hydrolyzing [Trichuris trichiura]
MSISESFSFDLLHPITENGKFKNPWPSSHPMPTFMEVLRWKFQSKNRLCSCQLEHSLGPYLVPDFHEASSLATKHGLSAIWLGHSTVLVNFMKGTFLTDPIFSLSCSPLPFCGPKRISPIPCKVSELPEIDGVIISHNHYDHLDLPTVRDLISRFGSRLTWFVPSGLKSWFSSLGDVTVNELTWNEEISFNSQVGGSFRIVCLPSQHWSMRSVFDRNRSLWCSWAIIGEQRRFFFAGDTGYCPAFKVVGTIHGPFDLAAIPIGCYEPRWFMKYQHVGPEEALQIHKDVRSRTSLGIHWGTYEMGSYEHATEPPCKLAATAKAQKLENAFITLAQGEIWKPFDEIKT